MSSSTFEVCEYLNNRYLDLEQSFPQDNIQEEIDKLSSFVGRLKEGHRKNFEGIDIKKDDLFVNNDVSRDFGLSPEKLINDALMIQFDPDAPLPQFVNAHQEIRDLVLSINLELREKRKLLNESKKSIELENLERILKIFKSGDGAEIKLSGNVSLEDYNYIIELLDESNLPLYVINEFLLDLNDAIANYKYKKEKLDASIEKESRKEEYVKLIFDKMAHRSNEKVAEILEIEPPEYNSKRIYRIIERLKMIYDGKLENPPINKDSKFDKTRIKLYYSTNKEGSTFFDENVVLYDLINFISPDIVEERFRKKEITPRELDAIRNVIYKEIINKCKYLIHDEMFEEPEQQRETKDTTLEQFTESLENIRKHVIPEPAYFNENIKGLDEEQTNKVEYAKRIVHDLKKEFSYITKYPIAFLQECLKTNDISQYKFDKDIVEIAVHFLPKFEESLEKYEKTLVELQTNRDFEDSAYLEFLEDDIDELLTATTKLIRRFEEYQAELGTEVEEFSPDINNIVMLYHVYPTGESPIPQDIKDVVATGQVDEKLVYDGLGRMEYINTITNGQHVKKIAGNKHNLDDLRIYRYRQGAIRYVYLDITIDDDNKEVIKEKYGLKTDSLRLLLVPYIFYKHGNKWMYDVALTRVENIKGIDENQLGSILWIKSIFGNKFTEETKKIAFELIDHSQGLKNVVDKGGEDFGSY